MRILLLLVVLLAMSAHAGQVDSIRTGNPQSVFDTDGNLVPSADQNNFIGSSSLRWGGIVLKLDGDVFFDDGTGSGNDFSYADGTGPRFFDNTVSGALFLNLQSLTTDRTLTVPDQDGTILVGIQAGSGAETTVTFQPGLLTSVTNTKGAFSKFVKASTVDNIVASAVTFTCSVNPVVTFYECAASTTCASSPTTIGSATITAAGTAVDGTVSNSAITAGHYVAWAISAGTCTALDISATAQVHAN